MTILPPVEGCGEKCVKLNVRYELDVTHRNALYCHEGQEGVKGQGPMVIAFEGRMVDTLLEPITDSCNYFGLA